jgi:IS5 family transposase
MLLLYLMHQWHSLSEPSMEEALFELFTMHRFAGIVLISNPIFDESTILTFPYLL